METNNTNNIYNNLIEQAKINNVHKNFSSIKTITTNCVPAINDIIKQ